VTEDWRVQGQDQYLAGEFFEWRRWFADRPDSDHDHCAFCWVHFGNQVLSDDPDTQLEGWVTADGQHWVCGDCFRDFRERFSFHTDDPVPGISTEILPGKWNGEP
jgi:hypothetical protein